MSPPEGAASAKALWYGCVWCVDVRLARAGRSRVGEDVGKWDVRMSGSSHVRDFDLNLKDPEARYLYKSVENRL